MGAAPQNIPLLDLVQDAEPSATPVRVALVNAPFAAAQRPSIQCGLLKAELVRAGHTVDVHYLNLELAAELGAECYREIAEVRTDQLLGEWLFSVAAFGYRPDEESYRQACPSLEATCRQLGMTFEDLCRLRNELLPARIERWIDAVDWGSYAAVGFTSTFEQTTASFALARRIKERHPELITIFGGANFDGEMGPAHMRAFPWIDYAVVGEGDEALPRLIGRIARGESGVGIPGVAGRVDGAVVEGGAAPSVDRLDALPDPDYDEYFATLFRLGRERVIGTAAPKLLFESARGCWWGQKHHCTFCGLNANGMAFRSKSPERVLDELRRLADRYQIINFAAVDNIIDMRYLDALCAPLTENRYDYQFFYEVKANLTRAQLSTLAKAGIRSLQPGIESLSTHLLQLMRKGTTMLRNVRLLKWGSYYGMNIGWNLLMGFPGETIEDYQSQERLLPLLMHLQPPEGSGPIWLERFSPYFTEPSFAVRDVRPRPAYASIFPAEQVDLHKIAYFFDYTMDGTLPDSAYDGVRARVDEWKARWQTSPRPLLVYQRSPDWLQVIDRRDPANAAVHALHGVDAAAYEICADTDHTPERVAAVLAERDGRQVEPEEIRRSLRRACELGLMVEEESHFLSLALPVNQNW